MFQLWFLVSNRIRLTAASIADLSCVDLPAQVIGKVPTISINKTDGCHVYLSSDSLNCEIISAKSSEMNVLVPGKDGEFVSVLLTFGFWMFGGSELAVQLNIPLPCFSTDGAPHSGAVQDRLEWQQAGHHSNRDSLIDRGSM